MAPPSLNPNPKTVSSGSAATRLLHPEPPLPSLPPARLALNPTHVSPCPPGCSPFSELPPDLLQRILSPLSTAAVLAAGQACRSWRAATCSLREAALLAAWGKRNMYGQGDVEKALDCLLKGATRGSTEAMVDAGQLLRIKGCKEEAVRWDREAAEAGNVRGQHNLALVLLHEGEKEKSEKTLEEAVHWLKKSATGGNRESQYPLALCFQQGRGTPKDLAGAALWFEKAAAGGNIFATFSLAMCLQRGEGCPANQSRARSLIAQVAKVNHPAAHYEHAINLLKDGDGVKSLVFLERSARGGHVEARKLRDHVVRRLYHRMHPRVAAIFGMAPF